MTTTRSAETQHVSPAHLPYATAGLFMIGVSTGGRISELLSLQIGDVYQNGGPVTDMLFEKSIVKGGEVSGAVPVNADGRLAIDELIDWHGDPYENINPSRPLFPPRHNSGIATFSVKTQNSNNF